MLRDRHFFQLADFRWVELDFEGLLDGKDQTDVGEAIPAVNIAGR
jgi:hypothetical protein